jgi:hypothetical protein
MDRDYLSDTGRSVRARRRSNLTPLGQTFAMGGVMIVLAAVSAVAVSECGRDISLGFPAVAAGPTVALAPNIEVGGGRSASTATTAAPRSEPPAGAVSVDAGAPSEGPGRPRLEDAGAPTPEVFELARAILEYGRTTTGKPDWERAKALARLAVTHCAGAGGKYPLDPWTVAALMRHESGFRLDAVSTNADGTENRGILQLHEAYTAGVDPFDPAAAVPEGCRKLRRWRELCPRIDLTDAWALVGDEHDWLAHWFGGNHPAPAAHAHAAEVRYGTMMLEKHRR